MSRIYTIEYTETVKHRVTLRTSSKVKAHEMVEAGTLFSLKANIEDEVLSVNRSDIVVKDQEVSA